MIEVRRLAAVGAVLGLAAVIVTSQVRGGPGREKQLMDQRGTSKTQPPPSDPLLADALAVSRFAEEPFVVYESVKGERYFAEQLRVEGLPVVARRPRDYAVLMDSSASKANGPLAVAKNVIAKLIQTLPEGDRLALWSLSNDPRALSKGFQSKDGLKDALTELSKEYPSGAVNLKKGFADAVASFDQSPDRQRVVLFIGDGKSYAGPIDADDRAALCQEMVRREIACFTVPVGEHLDPLNLHGFPNATGGKCVRLDFRPEPVDPTKPAAPKDGTPVYVTRIMKALGEAVDAPILYPHTFTTAGTAEVFPSRLPPLRSDEPTLVVGKLKPGQKTFGYKLAGTVAGQEFSAKVDEKATPEPEVQNFFLVNIVNQWREQKDRPALLRADRALAYAAERNQVARTDLLAKADLALDQDQFGAAVKLYTDALQIDPHSLEAKGGVAMAERLTKIAAKVESEQSKLPLARRQSRDAVHQIVRAELTKELQSEGKGDRTGGAELARVVSKTEVVRRPGEDLFVMAEPPAPAPEKPAGADVPGDPLNDFKARQAVADQQASREIEEAIRASIKQLQTDPNGAREVVKRRLDDVRNNPALSEKVRNSLSGRLVRALDTIDRQGVLILRDQAAQQEIAAQTASRANVQLFQTNSEERIRAQMRVFHNLMDQAREQDAYRVAQSVRRELNEQGRPVPPSVTAAYQMGLNGYHLRELTELKRIREERWLATLLQVEKSQVPFPDEPPVEYPAPAVWRAVTDLRKQKYESSNLGPDTPKRTYELRDLLNKTVKFAGFQDPKTTLTEALNALAEKYDVQFDVNEKAFKFEMVPDVLKTEIASGGEITPLTGSLASVLRKVLARIPVGSGATYLIRRDVIEITTASYAAAEKVIRVYPVADLVFPIPQSIDQRTVNQAATIFGFGGSIGSQLQLGGVGGVAGVAGVGGGGVLGGGQIGAILGIGGGIAGIGGLGGIGGIGGIGGLAGLGGLGGLGGAGLAGIGGIAGAALGQQGAQGFAGAAGFQGGFQGQANLGVGGGAAGVTGGQLGQFGNLGGQFGLQGGTQDRILVTLITQVVGKAKEWSPLFDPITGKPINQLDDGDVRISDAEPNAVSYYPPARALVVKGTSRIHTNVGAPITVSGGGGMTAAGRPDNGDRLVRIGGKQPGGADPVVAAPKEKPKPANNEPPPDPKKVWEDALARGVKEPGLIIATADFLAIHGQFDHAAEFLKAVVRQGIIVEPWVYEALAVALRESGGSAAEIERAETARVDLEPQDSQGYLKASKAMAKDKRFDRAVAFCRQASLLEPNVANPYAEALSYAELSKDDRAMEWAAGNLLKQDWPIKNNELQNEAGHKVDILARALKASGRASDAERLTDAIKTKRVRDLVIKMSCLGDVDLDLKVTEPTGSTCSALNRMTVGGGTLIGDNLADMTTETYTAARAFPGDYVISVERVRGEPLGGKAQLRIIQHQGTPDEEERLVTVDVKAGEPVRFHLSQGRRTEAAYVPPPSSLKPVDAPVVRTQTSGQVLDQLRNLADPEANGTQRSFRGSSSLTSAQDVPSTTPKQKDPLAGLDDRSILQARVQSFVKNSLDVTAQTVVTADRRYVKVSLAPVFNGSAAPSSVSISDPLFPGSDR